MKKNIGKTDRLIRVILAIIISGLVVGDIVTGTLAIVLLIISAILLLTSVINFCPLYTLIGFNSCPKD
jgi:hypothetical protein